MPVYFCSFYTAAKKEQKVRAAEFEGSKYIESKNVLNVFINSHIQTRNNTNRHY